MATLCRKHSALSEFGRWGVQKALWIKNPMDDIQRPPKPQHLPRPFSPEEMRRIMQLKPLPIERVIRGLLYYTGLRVSPICALKVGDLSFDELRYPNGVTFPGTLRTRLDDAAYFGREPVRVEATSTWAHDPTTYPEGSPKWQGTLEGELAAI